jgi:[acyl-carrier-protein] S-malonyltransferase
MMLALLFAGQGSQVVGMGAQLAASCAGCRATFRAADRALGFPLSLTHECWRDTCIFDR